MTEVVLTRNPVSSEVYGLSLTINGYLGHL